MTGGSWLGFCFSLGGLALVLQSSPHRILKRANEGRKAARAKGVKMGRKHKLTEHQQAEAIDRLAKNESARRSLTRRDILLSKDAVYYCALRPRSPSSCPCLPCASTGTVARSLELAAPG